MVAIQIVWELCLENWHHQLEKNKKVLEAETDVGESDVEMGASDGSVITAPGTPDVMLDDVPILPIENIASPSSGFPLPSPCCNYG